MEELDLQVPPPKMYDTLLNTAAKIGTTVASNPIGQMLLEYTERCLWTVEKSVQWCLLPEQRAECKDEDVPSTEVEEPAAKLEDPVEAEVRPLPWVLFLPLLVCLKAAKTSIDVCSYVLRWESVEPSSIVEFIQTRRNLLKEIKEQIKINQEEQEIKNKSSDDSTAHTSSSNEESEVPKIKVTHATPEKEEITTEAKTVTETAPPLVPETPTPPETEEPISSATSSPTTESDNGNDSSCTLEPETEDTKEEEDDFQSLKSSSTYFSPDSSYSLQSVSEELKAGDNVATELENITEDVPSIAAAIEDLRSLSITAETPLPTPALTSVKQTESPKKRTSFSSFFQVKRKTT